MAGVDQSIAVYLLPPSGTPVVDGVRDSNRRYPKVRCGGWVDCVVATTPDRSAPIVGCCRWLRDWLSRGGREPGIIGSGRNPSSDASALHGGVLVFAAQLLVEY